MGAAPPQRLAARPTMNAIGFAWRSLVRQPARAILGVLGVAAVGALLFDMLMLSRGLVLSMERLLDEAGFDIRINATDSIVAGVPIANAAEAVRAIAGLPGVDEVVSVRFASAQVEWQERKFVTVSLLGASPSRRRTWTVVEG